MPGDPLEFIDAELGRLKKKECLRAPSVLEGAPDVTARIGGRTFINFSSNNYLGLANDPRVREGARNALERYGAGSGASRLVSGTLGLHRELEEALARFEKRPDALVFSTGYQANVGLVSTLVGPGDAVFSDRLNHASIIDACRLSRAKFFVYPHADFHTLESLLERNNRFRRRLIITDGIFSMDADAAPLTEIAGISRRHNCIWVVDEAHGTGVMGATGRGAHEMVPQGSEGIVVGTLSKALGSLGGFVSGQKRLTQYLLNRARSYLYTTALAPACAGAALAALSIVREEPWRRVRLTTLTQEVRTALKTMGWEIRGHDQCPIIPVITHTVGETMRLARSLLDAGLFVPGIRPPTVPEGEGRLRITLMTDHSDAQVKRLIEVLGNAYRQTSRQKKEIFV